MATTNIELLAPAGSPQALDAAAGEGADAVCIGLKDFHDNTRGAGFTYAQFEGAARSLRRMGRKIYVAANTVFEHREADRVYQLLKYLAGLGTDGVLVQDFGIITMAREHFPSLKLFASRRMNIASARSANLLSRYGVSRVALVQDLSLDEIRDIRANTNVELEFSVHGALCVSLRGLCLFSSYLGGKSANRGICAQACRRYYVKRNEKYFDDAEEEEGGYYFSASDAQLIEKLPDLAGAGINSFRIEGRAKSPEYVATAVSAYRLVMDNMDAGQGNLDRAIAQAKDILKNDFARPKTVFLINGAKDTKPDWLNPDQRAGEGVPWVMSRRYISVIKRDAESSRRAPGRDKAPLPPAAAAEEKSGGAGARAKSGSSADLPGGFYVMVSRFEDMYVLQSARPAKAILPYSRKILRQLLGGKEKAIPFSARDIIISLDPFFPQEYEDDLYEDIPLLMEHGYTNFIVNNLGHFSLFRAAGLDRNERKPLLIAGPWLYAFNGWAWNFISKCGAAYCVSPLENNRQNLERSFSHEKRSFLHDARSRVFVTIFAQPSLFRIRSDLGKAYDFKYFSDSKDEAFRLACESERTLVYPREFFSIVDKTPFLREAGFSRFILDFSSAPLKKLEYKEVMEAANRAAPIPRASRFNWKNGFFARKPLT
ncbi:MAG: U32 family peptidase [Treponema sp.]|nr:U32 family peptidase [Treponema sp.]